MAKRAKKESRCAQMATDMGCCKVESVISIDERGQMVLPKEVRDKAKIRAGDKMTVISLKRDEVCCIALIKAEDFAEMVKGLLGPMMKEMTAKSK